MSAGAVVRVAITGIGLVTPLGNGVKQSWEALLAGRFIRDHSHSPVTVGDFEPRIFALARAAAKEAHAKWGDSSSIEETALVVGTSKGPVETWITPPLVGAYRTCNVAGELNRSGKDTPEIPAFGLASLAGNLASHFGIGGPILTVSAACASGLQALIRGVMLIQSGQARRVLVVAVESSLHPLFIANFERLGVLSQTKQGCRPLDVHRDGFLMSEAAAAVYLEAFDAPNEAPASGGDSTTKPVYIERFAMAGDAFHLTGGDPDAAAVRHALRYVMQGKPADLIHAHATGTIANDADELKAIEAELEGASSNSSPLIYSHKGSLGHSLGAAGLISVVINVLAHRTGQIPGNVRTLDPLPTRIGIIHGTPQNRPINRSIAMASGFGGSIAAVSLTS